MAENSTQPPHATRFIETTRGILSYAQLAPLLAERVLRVLQDIEDGVFAARPLDESLLLDLHKNICGDLTPDWAGRFRNTEVKVGQHSPPLPHQVPLLVRDYFADLNVRLAELSAGKETLLLEALAFAEGRLLFIHPFPDFNGRATRLLLAEILRRQELPPVELAPDDDNTRKNYIQALEAADKLDWTPLTKLWQERLEQA
jgi:CRISPR-associated endonuclease/helicase Cas3